MKFVIYNTTTGAIEQECQCQSVDQISITEGQAVIESEASHTTHYIVDGVPVEYSPEELARLALEKWNGFRWDVPTRDWVDLRNLDEVKALRKLYVNISRTTANQTSFTFEGKQIAVDPLSRGDIDAIQSMVLMTNAFPAGWPGGWKTLDNTYVAITTVAEWQSFYTAMVNQGTINFGHAQALKAAIDAATTTEEVEVIVW
jgi:hypothetical protein